MKNVRLKVLAGLKQGLSASHLSKIYSLPNDDVEEWRRLTLCGHYDWVDGKKTNYSLNDKRTLLELFFTQKNESNEVCSSPKYSVRLL